MKVTDFAALITKQEGGQISISVAQVAEVLRLVNNALWGIPYFLIRIKK